MVGLSDFDKNEKHAKIMKYKNKLDCIDKEQKLQPPLSVINNKETVVSQISQKQNWLKPEEVEQIINEYKSGLSIRELAVKYSCNRDTISKKLKSSNIPIRKTSPNKSQIDKMVELYQSGLSLKAIEKKIGFSDMTVRKHVMQRGVKMRGVHERMQK